MLRYGRTFGFNANIRAVVSTIGPQQSIQFNLEDIHVVGLVQNTSKSGTGKPFNNHIPTHPNHYPKHNEPRSEVELSQTACAKIP